MHRLFGEALNPQYASMFEEDISASEMLLIMGTSLRVRPVAEWAAQCPVSVRRVFVDRNSPAAKERDSDVQVGLRSASRVTYFR